MVVALIGVLSLLAVPLAAFADEGEESGGLGTEPSAETLIEYVFDSLFHVLFFGFNDPGAPGELDCTPPDAVTVEVDDDGEIVVIGGQLPEGCSALDTEGPNGQVNHGTIMSALVRAIRAAFPGDTPFGHFVRGFAMSDLGKGDDQVRGSDAEEELEEPQTVEPSDASEPNPGHGEGQAKGPEEPGEPGSGGRAGGPNPKPNPGRGKGHDRTRG